MNGQLLKLDSWDLCVKKVLLPLLERIRKSSLIVKQQVASNKILSPKLLPYGFRTVSKEWDETKVITLSGVSKCLIDFLPVLVDLQDFNTYWKNFLDFFKVSCLEASQEVSLAALKNFRQIVQYPFSPNFPEKIKPFIDSLWQILWDTWFTIGIELALACERNHVPDVDQVKRSLTLVKWSDGSFPILINGFMSQDSLSLYISIFAELYPTIRKSFGYEKLKQLLHVLRKVLLYHSLPASDSTQSRLRSDLINDIESTSPLQSNILDLVSNKIDFSEIESSPEQILDFLTDLVALPFVPMAGKFDLEGISDVNPQPTKKHTYMALSKKCIQLLANHFEIHGNRSAMYLKSFTHVLNTFRIPMSCKYNCPKPGLKDSTPLWRAAATTIMTIINMGLATLDNIRKGMIVLLTF